MTARLLDGRALAEAKNARTKDAIVRHLPEAGRPPRLDVVLVGDDPASAVYVRTKQRAAGRVGMEAHVHAVPHDAGQQDVADLLAALSRDTCVDGIVLQLPLPGHLLAAPLLPAIAPRKDVDGFHPENVGRLWTAMGDGLVPATPLAILWLLESAGVALRGAEVCIVSHSNLIGKPLAGLLVNHDATVTVCHKHTRDLTAHTRRADVLITAAGVPGLIRASHVKAGATVIDGGTAVGQDGVLHGDCAAEVKEHAGALTPVPGGVGPVTVAALLHNTAAAWKEHTRG